MTAQRFSPDLADHIRYDAMGREVTPLEVLAVFLGISSQEIHTEYGRQMAETGEFHMLKSWLRNAKTLQARYGTRQASELFSKIVMDGGAR